MPISVHSKSKVPKGHPAFNTIFAMKYLITARMAKIGDPIDAPPCPYKIQPEFQGKLLWITGSPGMGKSTSAQLLARNKGLPNTTLQILF